MLLALWSAYEWTALPEEPQRRLKGGAANRRKRPIAYIPEFKPAQDIPDLLADVTDIVQRRGRKKVAVTPPTVANQPIIAVTEQTDDVADQALYLLLLVA